MRLCLVLGVCGRRKIRLTHVGFIFFVIVHAFDRCFLFFIFMGLLLAPFFYLFFLKKKLGGVAAFRHFQNFILFLYFRNLGFLLVL